MEEVQEPKIFENLENGDLKITVKNHQELLLPFDGKKINIGKLDTVTVQIINKEDRKSLFDYITKEKNSAEAQIQTLKEEQEKYKQVKEDVIPEDILKHLSEALKKGNKAFKQKMLNLNAFIGTSQRKKQVKEQLVFLEKQLKEVLYDYDKMKSLVL